MNDLVKKYHLAKTTWTYKGFHGVLHTFFPIAQTGIKMKQFFGAGNSIFLFIVENNYVHWYWHDGDLTRIRKIFFNRLKRDSQYLSKLKKAWQEKIKDFDQIINKIERIDLSKLSNQQLAYLYDQFYERYINQFCYFMTLGDAISMHADRYFIPEFKKILGKDFNSILTKLVSTHYSSFLEQEELARRKLVKIYQKTGRVPQNLLAKHSRKYFYIKNNYAKAVYLTAADFKKMIVREAKSRLSNTQDIKLSNLFKEKERLIRKYKLNKWQKMLLKVMDEFFGIQDNRKKYVLIANYYQFRFLRELSRRTNIKFELLQYSIYPEFKNILDGQFNQQNFSIRSKICACLTWEKKYQIITGKSAKSLLDYFQRLAEKENIIKGLVAATGKATGRVKKILKVHDMVNMERGDILVSSMTRPEMTPAIKKAAAIITDEGGITCHAAIVSRELGIPCIIGTKIATKVLKDGDLVEVDANKGMVRIIK